MKYINILLLLLFSLPVFSQSSGWSHFDALSMRSIGPAGMSGRVTSIDAVHANPDIIYIGTASGGLWKSESGGIDWEPVFDNERVMSIGAVAIDQKNPDIIWAGTGEGNPRNSQNSGAGVYRSRDAGRTWQLMGLEGTRTIHRILIHPENSGILYVGAQGSAWGPNRERGVFKTVDGGKTWEKVLYIDDTTGVADMIIDPSNPDKLLVAMWKYGRKPWTFNSGGMQSAIYMTIDGGDNWKKLGPENGLPKPPLGRTGLAISNSSPEVIYALVESEQTALYRSDNGGYKWKKVADKNIGNRPFYYADIYVDPQNENRVYNLYSVLSVSEDGGRTFRVLLPYSGTGVHPDHHAFWIHPQDPDLIIEGNDGGLAISRDRGKNWEVIENLPLAQFYHINYDMQTPYHIYGGMQDNGSWFGPSYVWQYGGIRNHHFHEILFGDGFDVVPVPGNPRYGYAMAQGGNVYRYDMVSGRKVFIQPVHPEGEPLRFNWNAGIAQDPFDSCGVFFGSQYLHYSADCGDSWEIISPDLTTDDPEKQKQILSGGLTIDATRAENYTTILTIAPSPLNKEVIWVGTDDGNVQLTRDGGDSWVNLAEKLDGLPEGSWIEQIIASSHQEGEAYVIANDYRRNNWGPYAYKTADYGKHWDRIAGEDDVFGYTLSIVQDPEEPRLLFLGTEHGLYFSMDSGDHWEAWTIDYPKGVSTMDLKIHPREHDLIIGTFGRAIYVLDDIRPLRTIAREGKEVLEEPLYVFDPPKAWQVYYNQASGIRFTADQVFRGENRRKGAMITYWIKNVGQIESEEDSTRQVPDEKVVFHFMNESGDTVRSFRVDPDTGMNRIHWDMRENGFYYPMRRDVKPGEDLPSGSWVEPGSYTVSVSYQGYSASNQIEVARDPRLEGDVNLAERKNYEHEFREIVGAARESFEQLKKMKKAVESVNSRLTYADDSTKRVLQEKGKALMDTVNTLMELFMAPPDFEGYDHISVRINNHLSRLATYFRAVDGIPNQNTLNQMKITRQEVAKAVEKINDVVQHQWKEYRELVESASIPDFEEVKQVDMD